MGVDISQWDIVASRGRPVTEMAASPSVDVVRPTVAYSFKSKLLPHQSFSQWYIQQLVDEEIHDESVPLSVAIALLHKGGIAFKFHDDERAEEWDNVQLVSEGKSREV